MHHTADYKPFNPGVGWDDVDYSSTPAIQVKDAGLIAKPSNHKHSYFREHILGIGWDDATSSAPAIHVK